MDPRGCSHVLPGGGRAAQGGDHARLGDGVVAAEQRGRAGADRPPEVFHLELVRIGRIHGDALDAVVPPELDHRVLAVPGIVEEERALGADRLELVAIGQARRAVEQREHVAREAQRAGEGPVRPGRPDIGAAEDALGLASEQARAADAVAPDVHQRTAVDIGLQADVRLVEEPVAETLRIRRRSPIAPSATSSARRFVCG